MEFRVIPSQDRQGFKEIGSAFDSLFAHPAATSLTQEWVTGYAARRKAPEPTKVVEIEPEVRFPEQPLPHEIQLQALDALKEYSRRREYRWLVVLATGLGKTWLSAFDSDGGDYS